MSGADLGDALAVCADGRDYDLGCVQTTLSSRDADPALEAKALLSLVGTGDALDESCHTLMHLLGKRMPHDEILALGSTKAAELQDVWAPCGYGFLHGVFESLPLPPTTAGSAALVGRACEQPGISGVDRLHGECFHALGHAVHDRFDSVQDRLAVCRGAFPGSAPGMTPGRIGCYTGLAMKVRDDLLLELAAGRVIEPTAEAFAQAGVHCESADREWATACAPGFVQAATDSGARYVPLFLDWCSGLTGDPDPCFSQAGVYMGHFLTNFDSLEQVMSLCDGPSGRYPSRHGDLCRVSAVEGRMNTGLPALEAVEQVCAALQGRPDTESLCRAARDRYLS